MKTGDWITLLATQAGPAPRQLVGRRLLAAGLIGATASVLCTVCLLGCNLRLLDDGAALATKLGFLLALLAGAARLLERLARPGASARRAWALPIAAVLGLGAVAAVGAAGNAAEALAAQFWGHSWAACPWRIAALSLPALGAAIWALRGLAPTRPRLAGLAAGLFSGALGALGYLLYCDETAPLFVLVWYSLGIGLVGGAGALIGHRALRW